MAIVIAGYYGFGNGGDELILLSLIHRLQKEAPGAAITVLSKTPEETAQEFGVQAVDRWRPWQWVAPLLSADRFILGGGGLLQESSGPWNHLYYLALVVAAKLCGCRTDVKAIGVDPIRRPMNRFWTRWVLNHWADHISVRDEDSRQALQSAGVKMPITIEPDPVCHLKTARATHPTERIAMALASRAFHDDFKMEIVRLCNRIDESLHVPIDFLVFFAQEDESWTGELAQECRGNVRVFTWQNPRDLLLWLSSYKLLVASRFHALVLAASSHVPFVGIGDRKKVASFCRDRLMPYIDTREGWNDEYVFSRIAARYNTKNKSVILASRTG